jgi:hypothetical protein
MYLALKYITAMTTILVHNLCRYCNLKGPNFVSKIAKVRLIELRCFA